MTVGSTTTRPTTNTNPPSSSSSSGPRKTTVKKGENLWSIAKRESGARNNAEVSRYHQDLIRANPQLQNPDQIRPGQELNLPQARGTAPDGAAPNGAAPAGTQNAPSAQQAPGAPGADGRSTYQPSSSAPPPQTARPDGSQSSPTGAAPADPGLANELAARRSAANTGLPVRAQAQAEPPPGSIAGRPRGGSVVLPDANLRGDNYRRAYQNGTDRSSGTHLSSDETSHTRNRGSEQSRDTNSHTVETTRDGQRTTQLAEENQIRDRLTGQSESERTTVAQDQDGRSGSRTTNNSTDAGADDRSTLERLAEANGPNAVQTTGVLFDQQVLGDDRYRGVATVDNRHTTDDTGAGYEAHALAYRANANVNGTVDLRNGEVNVGVNGSVQADLVGVSGRAQAGSRDSVAGQVYAEGEAHIGARAEGGAGIVVGPNQAGVRVGGEAFVGAEATATVGYENRYGGVSATGRAQAGAGVAAGLDVGYNNGTIGVRADLGAALGLGLRGTVDINVNVGAIASDAYAGARSVANTVSRGVSDAADTVSRGVSDAADTVSRTASRAWSSINPFD